MAQKNFAKVVKTLSGDLLVQKDNGQTGALFNMNLTIITDTGYEATFTHHFKTDAEREVHFASIDQRFASQFIQANEYRVNNNLLNKKTTS